MISWEPINSRIIISRFSTRHLKTPAHIIQCYYASTNDSSEEDKDDFSHVLTEMVDEVKEKDLVMMILGDFDAKITGDYRGYEQVMGKHGLGAVNKNGERFADFFADCNLVISGSLSPPKSSPRGNMRII